MAFPLTYSRKEQIIPTVPTEEFAEEFFKSIENRLKQSHISNLKSAVHNWICQVMCLHCRDYTV